MGKIVLKNILHTVLILFLYSSIASQVFIRHDINQDLAISVDAGEVNPDYAIAELISEDLDKDGYNDLISQNGIHFGTANLDSFVLQEIPGRKYLADMDSDGWVDLIVPDGIYYNISGEFNLETNLNTDIDILFPGNSG